MKILSPLTSVEEVKPLCIAGADQFYCGLLDKTALNDRPNTEKFNFQSVEQLAKAVEIASNLNKEVFLAVNNLTPNLNEAIRQAEIAERIGMRGIIVSNLLLLKRLQELNLKLELCASCLTAIFNTKGINFLERFGIKTVHLPRQLGISDLMKIRNKVKNVELSVFGINGMCINIEAFCSMHYLKEEYFIPCHYFKTQKIIGNSKLSKKVIDERINSPEISCGICAFRKLKEIGMNSIKIEGRGSNLDRKLKFVKMAKRALELSESSLGDKEYLDSCKTLFKESFNTPCKPKYCYF
jgi:collagenase-like PrtC family protease